ncbi:MAG: Rpp14/Pop5 family protein [Haloferacaceae archaeon]
MKHLPKHLRPRWRYLGVGLEAWPDTALDRRAFQRALWESARALLGDPGSAAADLSVLAFEFADGEGETVVRARRGEVGAARAALACLDAVDGHRVGVHVRGVSGTVRACEERYLGRRAGPVEESHVVFEDASRDALTREDAVDVRLPDGFAGATDLDFRHE